MKKLRLLPRLREQTRDTIKNAIQINGVPLHVIDTAGLRETTDEVEKIWHCANLGRLYKTAHIALLLVDAAHGITETEKSILDRLPRENYLKFGCIIKLM